MSQLAILGGSPVIQKVYDRYLTIGKDEADAAHKVIMGGVLSDFLGSWNEKFYGGPHVRTFEEKWKDRFGVKHAISMNSATSCLYAAIGAVGAGPGDEVIVSPMTMTASATSILAYNAIPVFADIEPETFNIDPRAIEEKITPHTRALMIPNFFGHSADLDPIKKIAEKHNLRIIEDNAQSPLAEYNGKLAGTIGDIGVFSLNVHKHINTGEGGMCVTNDDYLAERLQMIRNHAEAVTKGKGVTNLVNLIGFNFRLGEIEAAIGQEQLKKLDYLVASRIEMARKLTKKLSSIPEIQTPMVKPNCKHVYYDYTIKYKSHLHPVRRETLAKALIAEGLPVNQDPLQPLYLQPMYQNLLGYGDKGCPFKCPWYEGELNYASGLCPISEKLFSDEVIIFQSCTYDLTDGDIELFSEAFHKVFHQLDNLVEIEKA